MIWLGKAIAMLRVVIAGLAARLGWFGGAAAVTALVLADGPEGVWNAVRDDVNGAVVDLVREKTGLELDPDEPLADASIAGALTARSGISITSVMDRGRLMADLQAHAAGLIHEKTGVTLTNLLSAQQVRADVVSHAQQVVKDRTGLDVVGAMSYDDVQARIQSHVRERLAELVAERLREAAAGFAAPSATLDELLAMVYGASAAKGIRARDVALGAAASLVVAAYARTSAPLKRQVGAARRRAQVREAQRRFRQRHGNRMKYDKVKKPDVIGEGEGGDDGNGGSGGGSEGGGG